jgi:hypothetical protein
MFWIESIFRRSALSFSVALFVTKSFNENIQHVINLSLITWGLTVLLFVFSWRIEKELKQIFVNENKSSDQTLWGQFENRFPKLANVMWSVFLTFAVIHIGYVALDFTNVLEVNGNRFTLLLIALVIAFGFRVFDRDTYRKK